MKKFKSIAVLAAMTLPVFVGASEVTGTLTTGISNGIEGIVVPPPVPPIVTTGSGGGGGIITQVILKKTDGNKDGKVDVLDFVSLMSNWGKTGEGITDDLTGDGKVDILDFVQLMVDWAK